MFHARGGWLSGGWCLDGGGDAVEGAAQEQGDEGGGCCGGGAGADEQGVVVAGFDGVGEGGEGGGVADGEVGVVVEVEGGRGPAEVGGAGGGGAAAGGGVGGVVAFVEVGGWVCAGHGWSPPRLTRSFPSLTRRCGGWGRWRAGEGFPFAGGGGRGFSVVGPRRRVRFLARRVLVVPAGEVAGVSGGWFSFVPAGWPRLALWGCGRGRLLTGAGSWAVH
jgi:hypothetical protein